MDENFFSIQLSEPNGRQTGSIRLAHLRLLAMATSLAAGTIAVAQAPPVLNTPYRCANGIAYIVTICKPFGATDQWCQWTEQQNGRTVTTVNTT